MGLNVGTVFAEAVLDVVGFRSGVGLLGGLVEEANSHLSRLGDVAIGVALGESFEKILDDIGKIPEQMNKVNAEIERNTLGMVAAFENASKKMVKSNEEAWAEMTALTEKEAKRVETIIAHIGDAAADMQRRVTDATSRSGEALDDFQRKQQQTTQTFDRQIEDTNIRSSRASEDFATRSSHALEQLGRSQEQFDTSFRQSSETRSAQISHSTENIEARFTESTQRIAQEQQNAMAAYQEGVSKRATDAAARLDDLAAKHTDTVDKIARNEERENSHFLDGQQDRAEKFESAQRDLITKNAFAMRSIAREADNIATESLTKTNEVIIRLGNTLANIKQENDVAALQFSRRSEELSLQMLSGSHTREQESQLAQQKLALQQDEALRQTGVTNREQQARRTAETERENIERTQRRAVEALQERLDKENENNAQREANLEASYAREVRIAERAHQERLIDLAQSLDHENTLYEHNTNDVSRRLAEENSRAANEYERRNAVLEQSLAREGQQRDRALSQAMENNELQTRHAAENYERQKSDAQSRYQYEIEQAHTSYERILQDSTLHNRRANEDLGTHLEDARIQFDRRQEQSQSSIDRALEQYRRQLRDMDEVLENAVQKRDEKQAEVLGRILAENTPVLKMFSQQWADEVNSQQTLYTFMARSHEDARGKAQDLEQYLERLAETGVASFNKLYEGSHRMIAGGLDPIKDGLLDDIAAFSQLPLIGGDATRVISALVEGIAGGTTFMERRFRAMGVELRTITETVKDENGNIVHLFDQRTGEITKNTTAAIEIIEKYIHNQATSLREAYRDSWQYATNVIQAHITFIQKEAGEDLYKNTKKAVQDLGTFFNEHRDIIKGFTSTVNEALGVLSGEVIDKLHLLGSPNVINAVGGFLASIGHVKDQITTIIRDLFSAFAPQGDQSEGIAKFIFNIQNMFERFSGWLEEHRGDIEGTISQLMSTIGLAIRGGFNLAQQIIEALQSNTVIDAASLLLRQLGRVKDDILGIINQIFTGGDVLDQDATSHGIARMLTAVSDAVKGFAQYLEDNQGTIVGGLERFSSALLKDFGDAAQWIINNGPSAAEAFGKLIGGVADFLIKNPEFPAHLVAVAAGINLIGSVLSAIGGAFLVARVGIGGVARPLLRVAGAARQIIRVMLQMGVEVQAAIARTVQAINQGASPFQTITKSMSTLWTLFLRNLTRTGPIGAQISGVLGQIAAVAVGAARLIGRLPAAIRNIPAALRALPGSIGQYGSAVRLTVSQISTAFNRIGNSAFINVLKAQYAFQNAGGIVGIVRTLATNIYNAFGVVPRMLFRVTNGFLGIGTGIQRAGAGIGAGLSAVLTQFALFRAQVGASLAATGTSIATIVGGIYRAFGIIPRGLTLAARGFIFFGDTVAALIAPYRAAATGLVRAIGPAIRGLVTLGPRLVVLGSRLATMLPILEPLGQALVVVGGAIGTVVAAVLALPVEVIVAGILLIVGAIVGLKLAWDNNWGDIQGRAHAAMAAIGEGFSNFGGLIHDHLIVPLSHVPEEFQKSLSGETIAGDIARSLAFVAGKIGEGIGWFVVTAATNLVDVTREFQKWAISLAPEVAPLFFRALDAIARQFIPFYDQIKAGLHTLHGSGEIDAWMEDLEQYLNTQTPETFAALGKALDEPTEKIMARQQDLLRSLDNHGRELGASILANLDELPDDAGGVMVKLKERMVSVLTDTQMDSVAKTKLVTKAISDALDELPEDGDEATQALREKLIQAGHAFKELDDSAQRGLAQEAEKLRAQSVQSLDGMSRDMLEAMKKTGGPIDVMGKGAKDTADAWTHAFYDENGIIHITQVGMQVVLDRVDTYVNGEGGIVNKFRDGINALAAEDWWQGFNDALVGQLNTVIDKINEWKPSLIDAISSAFADAVQAAVEAFGPLPAQINAILHEIHGSGFVQPWAESLQSTMGVGLKDARDAGVNGFRGLSDGVSSELSRTSHAASDGIDSVDQVVRGAPHTRNSLFNREGQLAGSPPIGIPGFGKLPEGVSAHQAATAGNAQGQSFGRRASDTGSGFASSSGVSGTAGLGVTGPRTAEAQSMVHGGSSTLQDVLAALPNAAASVAQRTGYSVQEITAGAEQIIRQHFSGGGDAASLARAVGQTGMKIDDTSIAGIGSSVNKSMTGGGTGVTATGAGSDLTTSVGTRGGMGSFGPDEGGADTIGLLRDRFGLSEDQVNTLHAGGTITAPQTIGRDLFAPTTPQDPNYPGSMLHMADDANSPLHVDLQELGGELRGLGGGLHSLLGAGTAVGRFLEGFANNPAQGAGIAAFGSPGVDPIATRQQNEAIANNTRALANGTGDIMDPENASVAVHGFGYMSQGEYNNSPWYNPSNWVRGEYHGPAVGYPGQINSPQQAAAGAGRPGGSAGMGIPGTGAGAYAPSSGGNSVRTGAAPTSGRVNAAGVPVQNLSNSGQSAFGGVDPNMFWATGELTSTFGGVTPEMQHRARTNIVNATFGPTGYFGGRMDPNEFLTDDFARLNPGLARNISDYASTALEKYGDNIPAQDQYYEISPGQYIQGGRAPYLMAQAQQRAGARGGAGARAGGIGFGGGTSGSAGGYTRDGLIDYSRTDRPGFGAFGRGVRVDPPFGGGSTIPFEMMRGYGTTMEDWNQRLADIQGSREDAARNADFFRQDDARINALHGVLDMSRETTFGSAAPGPFIAGSNGVTTGGFPEIPPRQQPYYTDAVSGAFTRFATPEETDRERGLVNEVRGRTVINNNPMRPADHWETLGPQENPDADRMQFNPEAQFDPSRYETLGPRNAIEQRVEPWTRTIIPSLVNHFQRATGIGRPDTLNLLNVTPEQMAQNRAENDAEVAAINAQNAAQGLSDTSISEVRGRRVVNDVRQPVLGDFVPGGALMGLPQLPQRDISNLVATAYNTGSVDPHNLTAALGGDRSVITPFPQETDEQRAAREEGNRQWHADYDAAHQNVLNPAAFTRPAETNRDIHIYGGGFSNAGIDTNVRQWTNENGLPRVQFGQGPIQSGSQRDFTVGGALGAYPNARVPASMLNDQRPMDPIQGAALLNQHLADSGVLGGNTEDLPMPADMTLPNVTPPDVTIPDVGGDGAEVGGGLQRALDSAQSMDNVGALPSSPLRDVASSIADPMQNRDISDTSGGPSGSASGKDPSMVFAGAGATVQNNNFAAVNVFDANPNFIRRFLRSARSSLGSM